VEVEVPVQRFVLRLSRPCIGRLRLAPILMGSLRATVYTLAPAFAALVLAAGCTTGRSPPTLPPPATVNVERADVHFANVVHVLGGPYLIDPGLNAYVNGVGQRVASGLGGVRPQAIIVIGHWHPEVWSLPGHVAISTAALRLLENEAELAALLAQQLARAAARTEGSSGDTPAPSLGVAGTPRHLMLQSLTGNLRDSVALITSRPVWDPAGQADERALQALAKAGYDPTAWFVLHARLRALADRPDAWRRPSRLLSELPHYDGAQLAALRAHVARLPVRNDQGEVRFQRALAYLHGTSEALVHAVAAEQALAEGRLSAALTGVEAALRIEAGDPWLYALRGDVQQQLGDLRAALRDYDDAQRLAPDHFAFPLARGLLHANAGNYAQAREELTRSNALHPTALAWLELGRMADFDGDRGAAREYFELAAESTGPAGMNARARLVGIDLPRNPARYLSVHVIDEHGAPSVQIANLSGVVLLDVNVRVRMHWADGHVDDLLPKVSKLDAAEAVVLPLPARGYGLQEVRAFPVTARTSP
jgi:beta-barrel assembly-enhancing protease